MLMMRPSWRKLCCYTSPAVVRSQRRRQRQLEEEQLNVESCKCKAGQCPSHAGAKGVELLVSNYHSFVAAGMLGQVQRSAATVIAVLVCDAAQRLDLRASTVRLHTHCKAFLLICRSLTAWTATLSTSSVCTCKHTWSEQARLEIL